MWTEKGITDADRIFALMEIVVYGYSASYTFTHQMQEFLKLVTHNEMSHEEWLQCYNIILTTSKEKNDWFQKKELVLPQQSHDTAKKLKMDI